MARQNGTAGSLWRRFITPPSSATLWKRAAWGLWLTPTIMGFPFIILPLLEPASILEMLAEAWSIYLLFFGIPFALGALCWRQGRHASDQT